MAIRQARGTEDKKRCDVMDDLVDLALLSVNFQKAHHILEMAIEADIRRTQIYNDPATVVVRKNCCLLQP